MKQKIFLIILIIILCIVNFIFNWFNGELFELVPIISLLYIPIVILTEFLILINILKKRKKSKLLINVFICLLYIINIFLIFVDMDIQKAKIKLYKNKESYIAEINELNKQNKQEYTLLTLDKEFYNLSSGNEIFVYTNVPLIVEFWIYRGLSIGSSTSLIYVENDNPEDIMETIYSIEYIEKIEKNWYFIKRN